MLLYSTILDIKNTMTKEAFIRLVIKWNQGSPYKDNIIPGIQWNGEKNIRFGDDNLWLEIIEYRNKNVIAVRYEKITDEGVIWDTDYIMNFNEMRMAIRLDRSYQEQAVVTDADFSTPHFISLLMQEDYIKPDGELKFCRNALLISEENVSILSDIVKRKIRYQLPVVYVSKTVFNKDPLSIDWLCSKLKGVAHVLVQADKQSNTCIREACDGENEYNGAIGVYYPNDVLGHKRCVSKDGNEKTLMEKVVTYVLKFSVLQKVDKLYTWQGVSNSLLNDRLTAQREERLAAEQARDMAENEVDDVYNALDDELKTLQRQVEELTRTNEIQTYEIQGLRAKLAQTDGIPIIMQGEEQDIYPGEIKDIVLSVIDDALQQVKTGSRREDILKDILDTNNYEKLSDKRKNEIKKLFKGYTSMSSSIRQRLVELGFTITEDGKHYKVRYKNDNRYMATISKTASDHRTGENSASVICQKML